jgi:hypothetical protein
MEWEVQHWTLADGWINTWTIDADTPETFKTQKEAETALEDFLEHANSSDEPWFAEPYDRSEFRVARVGEK